MSELTLAQLLVADPAPFTAAAEAWRRLADGLHEGAWQLMRGTRDLQNAWPLGKASEAAYRTTRAVRSEVSDAYSPAHAVAEALAHLGYAMADLREQAVTLVASASGNGMQVDMATGAVTVFPRRPGTAGPRAPVVGELIGVDSAQVLADALAGVLARARDLDDRTARVLAQGRPDPVRGFGGLPSRAPGKGEVERQRGRSPKEVNAWWDALTPQQQEAAITAFPELVGSLDGVPAVVRDRANRSLLDGMYDHLLQQKEALDDQIATIVADVNSGRVPLDAAAAELDRLGSADTRLSRKLDGLAKVQVALSAYRDDGPLLLGLETSSPDGKAIISFGNPDTAAHTAVWVPGMGTDLTSTEGNSLRCHRLYTTADGLTRKVPGDAAVVMWLGYDAPEDLAGAAARDRAEQGAPVLDRFVDGLRAAHDHERGQVTVIAHSYGSVVAGHAAMSGGLHVDDIVVVGSPGMDTSAGSTPFDPPGTAGYRPPVADLHVDPRHVWAGAAANDPVTMLPGHGPHPDEALFGGNVFTVDTRGHDDYWQPHSQSLANQCRIAMGLYSLVTLDKGAVPR